MAYFNAFKIARRLLACARTLVAANLTPGQREMIDEYMKARRRGLSFGNVIPWDSTGRAYFPVTRTISDKQAPQEIVDALARLGYSISSYRNGYAIKTIDVKNGKKTMVKNIGKILKNEVKDDRLSMEFDNRLGTSNKNQKRDFLICITHNPEDVGAMSTGRNWTSCMQLPSEFIEPAGSNFHTALRQVQYGGMCAYLIDPDDRAVERPYARIAIKRLENTAGTGFIYISENTIYGDRGLADECGMKDIVMTELDKSNKRTKHGGFRFRTVDPDSYSDCNIDTIFMLKRPDDILQLSVQEFKKYAYDELNIQRLDDLYLKSLISYMSKKPLNDNERLLENIYAYVRPEKRTKYLETVIDFIDIKHLSAKRKLPVEFIEKHPDIVHWPSIVIHCMGYGDNNIWYSYDELAQFSDRLEKAMQDIRNGKSVLNLQSFYAECDKALDSVNGIKPSFLNDFTIYKMKNHPIDDDHITGKISFTSNTKFIDLVSNGTYGNCIDSLVVDIKKQAASVLQQFYSFKGNTIFDGKDESEIVRMIENREVDGQCVEDYGKALKTNLKNHEFSALVNIFFMLDTSNATIKLGFKAYSQSDNINERVPRFDREFIFDYNEDIAGRITGIMQGIFKEIFK